MKTNSKSPEALIGKKILVAMIRMDENRHIDSQEQLLCEITNANQQMLFICRPDGRNISLPYVQYAFQTAARGTYTLISSGEKVLDPDFLTTWEIIDDKSSDGSFRIQPVHPDTYISNIPNQWDFEYRYDEELLRLQINEIGHEYKGKKVIIGITDEETKVQKQYLGTIAEVSYEHGIIIQLATGSRKILPPDLTFLKTAPPGEYRLRSTGEIVHDPEYLTYIVVKNPNKDTINDLEGAQPAAEADQQGA